ncbi:T9SS type A sorting domain-containing protein [Flavobacterium sp. j3]|uniref:T9SS type A sorting domain-containing protein n=1 Tax=Flavobacterium aureirubrum TaxID=3133147 RepID=A0ABU9NBF8_9FLAO
MKSKILTVILSIVFVSTYGQTSIVTTTNITRTSPKVGHMLNYLTKPAWTNQSFIDSVKTLNLEIIRYPGGTESQYFDWQTGRSVPASLWTNSTLFSHSYIGTVPHISYPLSELLYFYQQTNIKPIFCLNLLTKNLSNQIQMLQTASTLGIPVECIELGNELYFTDLDFTNKYPNPIDYVLDIKNNWIPQLSALFPNAKIAVIGSYDGLTDLNGNAVPSRINSWNDTLFAQNINTNAITFHYYLPPNTTTLSNPNITQALAAPFKHWPVLKANTVDNVTNGMECWITEYNLNDGNQTTYAIASSWAHGLYTASLFSLMLEETKIKMLLNHQIAGSPSYASLASYTSFGDTLTNRLTAEGNAMRLIHQAVKGNNTATKLSFSNNPTITVNTTNYPSLMGWVFQNGTNKELFILNLSNSNYSLDVSSIFSSSYNYEQVSATNPLQKDITTQNLIISKGNSSSNFQSVPYSLLYANNENALGIDNVSLDNDFLVYPNPTQNIVIIKQNNIQTFSKYQIFDLQGKLIKSKQCEFSNGELIVDISNLAPNTYLLKLITSNRQFKTIKIVRE